VTSNPDQAHPVVREARAEDLPRLLELMQQLSENGARPEGAVREAADQHKAALQQLRGDPGCALLVIEANGRVAGTCVLYLLPNLSHGAKRWAVVENVVVDAAERSRGYGGLLMAEAVRRATDAGCYRVSLMSNLRRTDAHRFYKRIGFDHSHAGFTKYLMGGDS
jgi:N-acetylglutamate synthase-like GNAT family acetyltransferase